MSRSFDDNGEYVPFFNFPPPPFAHNRPDGAPRHGDVALPAFCPVGRFFGGGGGNGALDSVLRVLGAPPLPGSIARLGDGAGGNGAWAMALSGLPASSSSVCIVDLSDDVPDDVPCMVMHGGGTPRLGAHAPAPPAVQESTGVGGVGRRSARLARADTGAFVPIADKVVKCRALKDALIGCSPRLQAKATRDRVLDAVVQPLSSASVAGLRAAAALKASSVPAPSHD